MERNALSRTGSGETQSVASYTHLQAVRLRGPVCHISAVSCLFPLNTRKHYI